MARRVGDPRTLALVLTQRCVAQWNARRRRPSARRTCAKRRELADRLKDPLLAGHAAYLGAHAAMEVGDLERGRPPAGAAQRGRRAARPAVHALVRQRRAREALRDQRARRRRPSGSRSPRFELGRSGPDSPTACCGSSASSSSPASCRASLDRGDPHLPDFVRDAGLLAAEPGPEITPSRSMPLLIGAAMSIILCEVGRLDDARAALRAAHEQRPRRSAARLHGAADPRRTRASPARGSATSAAPSGCTRSSSLTATGSSPPVASWFGATNHYLGLLAATLGRRDEADARFAAAERTYESLDAEPWLARLRHDRTAMAGSVDRLSEFA